jgi:hypothetical protein
MKNKTLTTTLALSLLFGSVPAFADGSTTPTSPANSVTTTVSQSQVQVVDPNSFLYSLEELLNQIKLMLTFNNTEKADLLIKQANDKLSELEALKANGTNTYNEEYSEKINEILKKTDQVLKAASTDTEKEDKETQEKEKQEIEKKQVAFYQVQKHSIEVLTANLEKVPEQGKKGIRNAIAKQEAKLKVTTTSQSDQNNVVQTTTAQNSSAAQSETVQSTSQTSNSTESTTSTTVKPEQKETYTKHVEVKVKHDNGLHLGQIKHEGEKEQHEQHEHNEHNHK